MANSHLTRDRTPSVVQSLLVTTVVTTLARLFLPVFRIDVENNRTEFAPRLIKKSNYYLHIQLVHARAESPQGKPIGERARRNVQKAQEFLFCVAPQRDEANY